MPTNTYRTPADYPAISSFIQTAAKQADKFIKDWGTTQAPANCWRVDGAGRIIVMDTDGRYRLITLVRLLTVLGMYGPVVLKTDYNQPISWDVITEIMIGRKDWLDVDREVKRFMATEDAYTFVQFS